MGDKNSILDIVSLPGEKIDLCLLRIDDKAITLYTKWMADMSINGYLGHNNHVGQWLDEKAYTEKPTPKEKNKWCIVEKDTRRLIGSCGCTMKDNITAELGICIGEETGRNKGYGTECVKLMVRYAFDQLNAHRVALSVVTRNQRAIRCYEKAGFVEFGRAHEKVFYDGQYDDMVYMEILRKDWELKNN